MSFLSARSRFEVSTPALIVQVVVGLFLCFTPGLDAPNYHVAFVLTVWTGLVGGCVGVMAGHRAATDVLAPARLAMRRMLWPALAPLGLLLLNGLRVRQCDVALGIAFFALGPLFTGLLAASLGAWLGAAIPRRGWGIAAFFGVWLAWVGADIAFILTQPAIFVFNPFGGYFSGNLYDTVIPIDTRYLGYRVVNLVQFAFFGAIFRAGWDPHAARFRFRAIAHAPTPRLVALIMVGVGVVAAWQNRAALGHQLDRDDVARQLGGRLEDDRLTLIFDRSRIPLDEAQRLLEDHRFRLEQLETALGARFPHRITSFIYGDDAEKKRLMGAGRVYLAKPWLREIHLNRVEYGDPVVLHELAHVVLGMYAPSPLRIPTRLCVVPHMALVEGAAEAFEWDTGALTSHEWSAAIRTAGHAPPLDHLLGPAGFYAQSSSLAYTMAGSFIRWLIDTRGVTAFTRAYADGDFDSAYGTPVDDLVAAWEVFLASQKVSPEAAAVATARFRKRAIFFQVCGLDVARKEAEAAQALGRGDLPAARAAFEQVIRWVPDDAEKRVPLVELAQRDTNPDAVVKAASAYFALPQRLTVTDARVLELIADAHLRHGQPVAAAALYPLAAAFPMAPERLRTIAVKTAIALASFDADPRRAALAQYLLGGQLAPLEADPSDPLAQYLRARRLVGLRQYADAIPLLEKVIAALPAPTGTGPRLDWQGPVALEAIRLLGRARFFAKDLAGATDALTRFVTLTPSSGDAARERDWLARIAWASTPP